MLKHDQIWQALDALAAKHGMSASGLAKAAGLDPTTFNKSKRLTPEGRERWPSTESLAKALLATHETLDDFVALVSKPPARGGRTIPLISFAQAGAAGHFDANGQPAGPAWDEIELPNPERGEAFALEISGEKLLPLYRDGDILILAPGQQIRRGDRVVLRLRNGEIMAKTLRRETARSVELQALDASDESVTIDRADVAWMHRIIWARQ